MHTEHQAWLGVCDWGTRCGGVWCNTNNAKEVPPADYRRETVTQDLDLGVDLSGFVRRTQVQRCRIP
ncbi:MAG: hypothetical protein ACPIOQ_48145, partial [Promethearchaeia archaeon]